MPVQDLQEVGPYTRIASSVVVATAAGVSTYGSWVQLSASCPYDTAWLIVEIQGAAGDFLLDIGIGAAGSEIAVLPGIGFSGEIGGLTHVNTYSIPFNLPSGQRIAARAMSTNAGPLNLTVNLYCAPLTYFSGGEYNAANLLSNVSVARGVGVDPGGTINTKGSYTTIVTNAGIGVLPKYLIFFIGTGQVAQTVTKTWLVDFAIGPVGSEQIFLPDVQFYLNVGYKCVFPAVIGPIPLPAWQHRISARAQCDSNAASERLIYIHGIGIR